MAVFSILHSVNNRYMEKEQPIHGVLWLNEKNAAKKLYYLSREWQYFPDHLLTPEMLKKDPGYYSRYISIGEYGGMEMGNRADSPYGCGTYRMLLILPEEEQTWAIALTEVFSAYRIYIDGELAGEVGNPDEEDYEGRIMNRVYTFNGKGTVEIVIDVADRSSVESGIRYIPVLGNPVQVNMQRGIRVLHNGFAMSFCFCILIGSLFVYVKNRTRQYGFFILICICVIGYSIYPLIHSFFFLPVQPWYALEALSYYLMLPCMICLEDSIMKKNKGRYLALILTAWAVAAFFLEIFAGSISRAEIFYAASWLSEGAKWLAAIYMLSNTFGEISSVNGKIILAGTTVYACSLAADRIWHLYEPITGGWFPEIGGTILTVAFGCILGRELAEAYKIRLTYQVYIQQTELRLLAQKKHYEKLKEQMNETSRVRHDMRQHLRVLATLLEKEQYEEMQAYLKKYTIEFQERLTYHSYCKNPSADAVFHYYEENCREKGISFKCQVEAPADIGITETDFCRLFGNLIENAIEAAQLCADRKKRFVDIQVRAKNNKLLIRIRNGCKGKLHRNEKGLFSTKHSGPGLGTASVTEITGRYGGLADFSEEKGVFTADIFLNMMKKDTGDKPFG